VAAQYYRVCFIILSQKISLYLITYASGTYSLALAVDLTKNAAHYEDLRYAVEITGDTSATFSRPLQNAGGIDFAHRRFFSKTYRFRSNHQLGTKHGYIRHILSPGSLTALLRAAPPRFQPDLRSAGTCPSRTTTASSTVTIPTTGSATLRITWTTGHGHAVYTNDCAYAVADSLPRAGADLAVTPTPTPSAAVGAAAPGSAGTALLAAALASVLPLLLVPRRG
jgi:hypothetical protein